MLNDTLKIFKTVSRFFFPFFIFLFPVLVTSIKAVLILAKLCKNTKLLNECFIKHWTEPTAFRFKFYLFSFHEWHCMMIGLKQTTKFKPRIKLNHNMYNNDYWNSLQLWPGHIFLFLSFQGADYFTFEGAMGDFRKKNILHTDLKGKKSCKEIPEENNSCSEHKYLSWRLMVEKKSDIVVCNRKQFVGYFAKKKFLPKPITYPSSPLCFKSKWLHPSRMPMRIERLLHNRQIAATHYFCMLEGRGRNWEKINKRVPF